MGLGDFVKKAVKTVEDVTGDVVGETVGLVDKDLGDKLDRFIDDNGLELALIATGAYYGGAAIGSMTGSSTIGAIGGTSLASAGFKYLGAREEANLIEENARRQAEYAREVAAMKSMETRDRAREEGGDALTQATGTGAFTGARSFAPSTGIGSVLATNRARAIDLSERLLGRGEREAGMIRAQGRDTASAHRTKAVFDLGKDVTKTFTQAKVNQLALEAGAASG